MWIGAVALSLAAGGLLAPSPARAVTTDSMTTAPLAVGPSVTITPSAGSELTDFTLSVAGFEPGTESVTLEVTVDGAPYTLGYDTRRNITAAGTGSWSWPWTAGDPYGTYTFTFTDQVGHEASATLTVTHSPTAPVPAAHTGLMIDAASAPSLEDIDAWRSAGAPYAAIGVYIAPDAAVDNRHDKEQAGLDRAWVQQVQSGSRPWHVVPIHVGRQAPDACQTRDFVDMDLDADSARAQGEDAARSAAAESEALGIDRSSPIVADIEAYSSTSSATRAACAAAVQSYLAGWTSELHALDWRAGVYGNPSSVAADLTAAKRANPGYLLPDVIWTATDDHQVSASVSGLPSGTWKVMNQYLLDVERTYGDRTLAVDETAFDWAIWDRTAPSVRPSTVPWLVRAPSATFTWTGLDTDSGLAGYEVRSRRAAAGRAPGRWSLTSLIEPAATGRTSVPVRPGEQVCVEVRAVDRAGNRSAWTQPSCSTRLRDDRAAKTSGGWQRTRQPHPYGHTLTSTSRKGAVLTLGKATAGSQLGVVRTGRGPLTVAVGGHRVATLTGQGLRALVLPRSGTVTLTSASGKKVTVDAYVLAPRPRA